MKRWDALPAKVDVAGETLPRRPPIHGRYIVTGGRVRATRGDLTYTVWEILSDGRSVIIGRRGEYRTRDQAERAAFKLPRDASAWVEQTVRSMRAQMVEISFWRMLAWSGAPEEDVETVVDREETPGCPASP